MSKDRSIHEMTRRKLTEKEKKSRAEEKRKRDRIRQKNLRTDPLTLAKERERDRKRKRRMDICLKVIDLTSNRELNDDDDDIEFDKTHIGQDIEESILKADGIDTIF